MKSFSTPPGCAIRADGSRGIARAIWLTGVLTVVYVAGKLTGHDRLIDNPAYALSISPVRFLKTFHLYLNPLLYQEHRFRDPNTVQLLIAMLVIAAWLRSGVLLFAWFWLLLTVLPVAFIAHYSAFFEYLPAVGWTLYAATLLVMIRRVLMRLLSRTLPSGPMPARISQAVLFLSLAAFLAPLHARETRKTLPRFLAFQPPSRELTEGHWAKLRPVLLPRRPCTVCRRSASPRTPCSFCTRPISSTAT